MSLLLHGTSSWSSPDWVGSFYPKGMKPADFLTYYATRFPAVEADVTYYRIPSREMVRGWVHKTPASFRLCAKFPRTIVHAGEGPRPDSSRLLRWEEVGSDCEAFLESMGELGTRCGPLVLQFPYFNKQAFGGPGEFLDRLDRFLERLPADFRYAVEVRNRAWLGAPLHGILRERRVALVLTDMNYMPHPSSYGEGMDSVTADFLYLRLIGDRKKVEALTDRFDRIVLDNGERLEAWAQLLGRLMPHVPETYAFANNHFAGHGPATISELVGLLEGSKPDPT